jgi:hypothetical protein
MLFTARSHPSGLVQTAPVPRSVTV